MAINIGGFFNFQQNGVNTDKTQEAVNNASMENSATKEVTQLKAGQVISGEVTNIDGDQVELKLAGNQTLTAKLDSGLNVSLGQLLSFEVKTTSSNHMALRPLYTNLSQNYSVTNALKEASMPLTNNNMRMVSTMMEEGMPVNRQALYNMFKSVSGNTNVDISTAVQLTKLGLPVNELNATQLENYKNFEHQIVKDVDTLTDGLTELYKEGAKNEDFDLLSKAFELISDQDTDEIEKFTDIEKAFTRLNEDGTKLEDDVLKGDAADTKSAQSTTAENAETVGKSGENGVIPTTEGAVQDIKTNFSNGIPDIVGDGVNEKNGTVSNLSDTEVAILEKSGTEVALTDTDGTIYNGSALGEKERTELADMLKNIGVSEEVAEKVEKGDYNDKEVINLAKSIINNYDNLPEEFKAEDKRTALKKMLLSEPMEKLFKSEYSKQFVLEPRDIVKDGKIEELYKNILEQSKAAQTLLENAGKGDSPAAKSAQNISDNVNFMNQLNQMLTYVQLPLRMNQENTHGELYVYTKKKNLKNNDGNVSALLHLDMENLGPMDVYVALQQQKVKTHFYLQDEATLDFIEQNIHLLNERLAKKGYEMNAVVTTRGEDMEQESMADEFLRPEQGKSVSGVSKLSFDVRA